MPHLDRTTQAILDWYACRDLLLRRLVGSAGPDRCAVPLMAVRDNAHSVRLVYSPPRAGLPFLSVIFVADCDEPMVTPFESAAEAAEFNETIDRFRPERRPARAS